MSGTRTERGTRHVGFVMPAGAEAELQEDLDTARLVTDFQAGRVEAFATIYARYFDRVYGYLRVAFDSPHEAEDATQQVFTKVFEAMPRYEDRGQPFRVWLFVVVRNEAITQLKRLARLEPVDPATLDREREGVASAEPLRADETEPLGLESLNWIDDVDLLMFIERLPAVQRQALAMRYMLDLSNKQIAELLGRTPNDVAVLQRRGLAFLRSRLTAIGRRYEKGGEARMRAWNPQSRVLRERRFSLKR
jgi:RNA polymerase sigma factor (sigma-70 family)